ncbi:malonic semialdehyde reductase [Nocardioides abyssi]|uniref:Malonic semialdehyde reductase n=1 Tax=Nocardioides abyssi TaxID=3058370 RepID=A0ABT8EYJ7_9ACTN|nr:malonic semialdehyde reductase [Nocardioides abyssi]MDN4163235.1 malonic semialdehyde reductase [Nocardioides abyssi]
MTYELPLSPDAQALLFRDARTANAFTDEPVTDEQVAAIYDLVKYGPTAMNTQPLRIVLVRAGEARERLLKHMAEGNREKTAAAPLVAVLAADTDFHEHLTRTFPHFAGAKDVFADDEAREQAARFNATLQVGYFLVGVRAAGLAAGPMTGFDAAALDADLFEGTGLTSLVVVNLGRPAENAWFDRLPRLDLDQVVREA